MWAHETKGGGIERLKCAWMGPKSEEERTVQMRELDESLHHLFNFSSVSLPFATVRTTKKLFQDNLFEAPESLFDEAQASVYQELYEESYEDFLTTTTIQPKR